ncbi:secreted protein [Candidatus Magnetomorum sp. HK-1]|nr:secreted protein [Candidatus Magnetomorum sp. HK-1]
MFINIFNNLLKIVLFLFITFLCVACKSSDEISLEDKTKNELRIERKALKNDIKIMKNKISVLVRNLERISKE